MFHWQEQWKVNFLYSNTAEGVGFISQFLRLSKNVHHLCFLLVFPWKFTDLRDDG